MFTVRSAAWYCLRARCAGGTGGNCLIFTVLAAAVPGAVRRCLRAHRHAGCAAATVACTVGSAGPACLGFCVTFLSLLSSVLTACHARACRRGAWGRTDMLGVRRRRWHAGWISVHKTVSLSSGTGRRRRASRPAPQGEDRRASKHIKVAPRLLTTDGSTTCFLRS